MKEPEKTTTVTVSRKCRIEITREHILSLCKMPPNAHSIQVSVYVPGGGDWSNTDLDIEKGCPVSVTFETREKTEE